MRSISLASLHCSSQLHRMSGHFHYRPLLKTSGIPMGKRSWRYLFWKLFTSRTCWNNLFEGTFLVVIPTDGVRTSSAMSTSHLPRTWKHSSITSNFNNAARFTYTCWFGSRRCLLFAPIWCNVSVPWENRHDAFLVANAKKYDKSCLQVNNAPDAFITDANGRSILQFQDTDDDTQRNRRAYITTLLGALKYRTRHAIDWWQSHVTQIRELLHHQDSRIANVGSPIL